MQTILTKTLPVTATKPARVKAHLPCYSTGPNIVVSVHSFDSAEAAHRAAARLLMDKMKWAGSMIGGHIGTGQMAWVFNDPRSPAI